MKKYCIVIGENNEDVSRKVQEALFEAGFNWYRSSHSIIGDAVTISVNHIKENCISFSRQGMITVHQVPAGMNILTPSQILNGGAQKLDGAKVVEPVYLLSEHCRSVEYSVLRCEIGKKSVWEITGNKTNETVHSGYVDGLCEDGKDFFIITKADVAYIRDNAEKAKELGMVLRKAVIGDMVIFRSGDCGVLTEDMGFDWAHVAGHRYCRKVEAKVGTPKFCHQCSTRIAPKDSKFCRMCGAEL